MNAQRKIMMAVGTLARVDPFLLSLLLGMERKPEHPSTMSIDGVTLRYNPAFVESLEDDELAVVLAHEAMHLAHKHHMRRGDRDKDRWNEACDYAINGLLAPRKAAQRLFKKDGLLATNDGMPEGMTAEWYYNKLKEKEEKEDEHEQAGNGDNEAEGAGAGGSDESDAPPEPEDEDELDDGDDGDDDESGDSEVDDDGGDAGGSGDGSDEDDDPEGPGSEPPAQNVFGEIEDCPLSETEADIQYTQVMAQAQQSAMAAGTMPGWAEELVSAALRPPELPWRMLLRQFITRSAKDRVNYARPSRRYPWMRSPIMPGRYNKSLGNVALCIDTSGSMPSDALTAILSEVRSLLTEFPESVVTVIQFDTRVHTTQRLGQGTILDVKNWKWHGRGGTNCCLALRMADSLKADVTVVATDGGMSYPEKNEVRTPVLWCMTTDFKPPFGLIARMRENKNGGW